MPLIKVTPADKLFSDYIRERDGWCCVRCHHQHDPEDSHSRQGIHCSHFYSRGKFTTRFDTENCDALCMACHLLWGGDRRQEYREFKIKQLGQAAFDALTLRSNMPGKRDFKLAKLYVQELIKKTDTRKLYLPTGAAQWD